MNMAWKDIPVRERDRLLELKRAGLKAELVWEAQRWGFTSENMSSFERQLRDYAQSKPHLMVEPEQDRRPAWNGYLRVTTDNALFISDIEVPDHNEELLYYAREVQRIYELDTTIWGGDIMKQDEPGVATHDSDWQYRQPTFEENVNTTRQMFREWFDVPNQFFVRGNHDAHLDRSTLGSAWFGMFFPDYPIKFSRYSYMYINTSRGLVKMTHPHKKFGEGGNAIELGRRINAKDIYKGHIVLAHTHQGVRGHTKDGQYEVLALGCMRDPNKTQYKNIDDNTFGEWQPGFAFMKDGYFHMLNLYTTDWKMVLKGYAVA
jgi:hypothetical protein